METWVRRASGGQSLAGESYFQVAVAFGRVAMSHGLLLPVSVAMKREEQRYLDALQSFSRPARECGQSLLLIGRPRLLVEASLLSR